MAFDPRLLRYARTTRAYLLLSVGLGGVTALLVVAQAWLLADTVAGAFAHREGLAQLRTPVALLLAVIVGRAAVSWCSERAAHRASARAKSELRTALVEHVAALGPGQQAGTGDRPDEVAGEDRTGGLAVLATHGVDALDGYFSRYLPQVFLAVIVPVTVIAVVAGLDWISAAIIAVTVPLVPLFMALVGASTGERTERQLHTLQRLAGRFLDAVAGLPTLKVFGRAKAQADAIGEMTDRYRHTTMLTLRIAFLSSLVLELIATISVALVAVAVGLRLLGGHLDLRTALFVLILAPEAYLPLRLLGTNFHASAEGMKAAEQVFTVLARPLPARGSVAAVPDPSSTGIVVRDLQVTYPGRGHPALRPVSFTVHPGELLAIVGPSGCGKSTLLGVLLGLVAADSGSVRIGDRDLNDLDIDVWRSRLAWVPQRPHLFAASLAENVCLGRPDAPASDVARAVARAGLDDVVARLPEGLDTRLGERGAGLSAGERQRVALARSFLLDAPLLLLDEPTANLDGSTEDVVLRAIRRLVTDRTVVLAAHRPELVAMADRVVSLVPEEVAG
jgi:thiol reductant ABC exporter CydD subunit